MHLSRVKPAFPSGFFLVSLLTVGLAATTPPGQGFEEAQIEAAKATDRRFLNFVALFQETILKVWGADAKIGRLDASESRVLANIHIGGELHGLEFTARRLKDDKKFVLRESDGSAENLLDLSVLDQARLKPLIDATHAMPAGTTAHLFKIELGYFPSPVNRNVALVQMIGIGARVTATYDLATGDPFDLAARVPTPATSDADPQSRHPKGGLREWFAAWEEAIAALEGVVGAPIAARSLKFSSTGIQVILAAGQSSTAYKFDNEGLHGISMEEPDSPAEAEPDPGRAREKSLAAACQVPFDPRRVQLSRLGDLADRALATVALPHQDLIDARVEPGAECGQPEIRFLIRNPTATAEVAFNQEGTFIATEIH